MFDTPTDRPGPLDESVDRLCRLYDSLLDDPVAAEAPAAPELAAMARIFDLPAAGRAADVWRDVRAVLIRQTPAEVRTDGAPSPTPGEPLTLLLVEDDADMAANLMEALSEAGHRVVGPFHNAEAAEVSAALHAIDLALLDINLSGRGTGADLARTLRDRWGVSSIFLSGDVTATSRHADLALAILTKPYGAKALLETIDRVSADGLRQR
ncbi:hypothetical protein GCM10009422_09540 [Brevundimonas kwangchunensis]|uniref:Response regulatory domain-containing protein n=1 Tax=Brevundimonas kwangchunensis TaxID=322163 RepID=A0ABP3RSV1_9CAUL